MYYIEYVLPAGKLYVKKMIKKTELRKKAIAMRKRGITYGGIMDKVPVAKSTLALWFKDVKLSKSQTQRITQARLEAGLRGGQAKKNQRIAKMKSIIEEAEKEIGAITKRELWLIGTTLYWAEGSKEKEWRPGSRASFINMDPIMIQVFLKWVTLCKIDPKHLDFDIYVHDNHKNRIPEIKTYWAAVTGFPISKIERIYFKRNTGNTKRKNIGQNYNGIMKIYVRQSSSFLRKITGWTRGIYKGINNG